MFVPVVVRLPTSLVRVKTAARFTAEDPWNSNYPAQFTVDEYLTALRGSRSLPETTHEPRWMGGFHRALHSQPNGAVRLLPESLIELWLNEEVPIETLPRLLKAIEPTLKQSDYRPILHNSFMKIGAIIEALICIALELIAIFVVIMEHLPLPLAIAIPVGIAFIFWGFLYLLYFGKIRRRRRQMSQIRSLLARQAEPISPTMAEPQTQSRAKSPPLAEEPLIHSAFDDAQLLVRNIKPQPTTPNLGPAGYTFDSMLRVPDAMEPRIEPKLKEDIPELQWEDLAENWGKIRIMGTNRESFQRIVVSISRKEAPGPFKLRIKVCTVLEVEAREFYKAMVHRLQLSLLASLAGDTTVTDTVAVAPHGAPFVPPFFSLESILDVPQSLEPSMALRIQGAIPELTWTDLAQDLEQVRMAGRNKGDIELTLISITRDQSCGPFQIWIHLTSRSWFTAQGSLQVMQERIRSAIFTTNSPK